VIRSRALESLRALAEWVNRRPKPALVAIGLAVVPGLGYLDYVTGPNLSMLFFYLAWVTLTTWLLGSPAGVLIAGACAVALFVADLLTLSAEVNPLVPYFNALARFAALLVVAFVVAGLRGVLGRERQLARTDYLTGADNWRSFSELAELEIRRALRYGRPLTLLYIDLDDFKSVNDRFGHGAGDDLLREITQAIRTHVRATDVVARLGGDEFVVLLPETGHEDAETAVKKLHPRLVEAAGARGWPVTVSIGVATCPVPPDTVDELIRLADGLMYVAKSRGKNRVHYETVPAPT